MSGARADGTFTREQRIEAIRLVKCDKWSAPRVAERMGCGASTIFVWMRNPAELAEALEAGPMEAGEAPPPRAAAAGPVAQAYTLPPIGEEDPEAPSADFMAYLAGQWALVSDATRLDHLAGWPEGTVQSWFDRERTERGCAVRVAQLRRAAAMVVGQAVEALLASGNPVALRGFLVSRGALVDAPPPAKNAAEGRTREEIVGELRKRHGIPVVE
jgi:hypothetical protein